MAANDTFRKAFELQRSELEDARKKLERRDTQLRKATMLLKTSQDAFAKINQMEDQAQVNNDRIGLLRSRWVHCEAGLP